MNALRDLNDLKRQWQIQPKVGPDVAALRKRIAADTRAQTHTLVLVSVMTVVIIGAVCLHDFRTSQPDAWFGAVVTTLFSCVVWSVALWMSRGTWRPRDESTVAYVDVSIHRCRSVIAAAPIGIVLYIAGVAGALAWKQRQLGLDWSQLLETPSMIIAGWIGAPLYSLGMLWNARRQRRRLAFLMDVRKQLGEG
jgi:hypothetical protein